MAPTDQNTTERRGEVPTAALNAAAVLVDLDLYSRRLDPVTTDLIALGSKREMSEAIESLAVAAAATAKASRRLAAAYLDRASDPAPDPMSPAGLLDQVEELIGQFCEVAVPDLIDTDPMAAADQVIRLGMLVLDYRRRVFLLYDDLIKKAAADERAAASSSTSPLSA